MNPLKKKSTQMMLSLLPVLVIAVFVYSFTINNPQMNRVYALFFDGVGTVQSVSFAALCLFGALCAILILQICKTRIDKKDIIGLEIKNARFDIIAAILLIASSSRLLQGVLYPLNVADSAAIDYLVPPLGILVFLSILIVAYLYNLHHIITAQLISTLVCLGCWVTTRIALKLGGYNQLYWVALALNSYLILRIVVNFSVKKFLQFMQNWLKNNYIWLILPVISLAAGTGIEWARCSFEASAVIWTKSLFWACAVFSAMGSLILYRKNRATFIENAFLLTILLIGLYMAAFLPYTTMCSWDEQIHYAESVILAQGDVLTNADWQFANHGVWGTYSFAQLEEVFAWLEHLSITTTETFTGSGGEVLLHQSIGYLPHSAGIWLAQILQLPYWMQYMLGRVGGLLFYALVMYASMKKLVNGKILLAVIALYPTNLFQACCFTYDSWVVCMVAFSMACFIGAMQRNDELLTGKELFVMLLAFVLGITAKGVYFPALLVMLFMPKEKFDSKKAYVRYLKLVVCTSLACFFVFMVLPLFAGRYTDDMRGGSDVNSVAQVIGMLKNPFGYLAMLGNFLKGYLDPNNNFQYTSFMAHLGGKDMHTLLFAITMAAALVDHGKADRCYDSPFVKCGSAFFLLISVCAVASVLYISFTPVGLDTINGCQPRYLAPLVFPFYMLVCNVCSVENWKRERTAAVLLSLSAFASYSCVWATFANNYAL